MFAEAQLLTPVFNALADSLEGGVAVYAGTGAANPRMRPPGPARGGPAAIDLPALV